MKTRSNAAGEEQSSPFLFPATESEDQDSGDISDGVDEDALDADDLDTDQITATPYFTSFAILQPYGAAGLQLSASHRSL